MGITTLTFSDQANGRLFAAWVNELVYSAGEFADFSKFGPPDGDEIILALACLPTSLAGAAKDGTSRRRDAQEFWSTVHANYDEFISDNPIAKIECIKGALLDAVCQLPESRIPESDKLQILAAITSGAASLGSDPRRQPR